VNYSARQQALVDGLGEDLDALLITDLTNVRYLCGYVGSNGIVLATRERRILFTDFRYIASATAQTSGVEIIEAGRDLHEKLAAVIAEAVPQGRIGFEASHVSVSRHERFTAALEGIALVPTADRVESLRLRKEDAEIDAMHQAAQAADVAFAACADGLFRGRTEREVAWELEGIMRRAGAAQASFDIIVASGERGAMPHAVPGDERIPPNTLVTIDMGAIVDGYASDCTRTFATGPLPEELARAYAVCAEAQAAALAALVPGIGGEALDTVARDIIVAAGFGERYRHGLGHGVGLQVHEAPGARPQSTDTLGVGMTITIEPDIYIEGLGGVRIEDLCVVTGTGHRVLTGFTKELLTVDS
jgi:Xaa-Pro aminopeptidase